MKTTIILALMCLSLTAPSRAEDAVATSSADVKSAAPPARQWTYFFGYDYFLPQTIGDGLKSQLSAQANQLIAKGFSTASFNVNTQGASGARFGALHHVDKYSDLGLSFGYVIGPTINSSLSASGTPGIGGQTINEDITFLRYLVQGRFNFSLDKHVAAHMGSSFGLATGRVEQGCNSSGAVACPSGTTRRTWTGFAWEFMPSISYKLPAADLQFGLDYAGFPQFNGDNQISQINWVTYGFFLGASF